jgi:superfamily II DNA or RNA helicase
LRHQWHEELRGRLDIPAVVVDSSALTAAGGGAANPWLASPVVISSIDFVKRPEVIRAMEPMVWDLLVLDEAHTLAGRSDRATAAQALARRARQLLLLTATPHDGDDNAFARLTTIGDIDGRFPLIAFRRTRADAGFPTLRRTRWLRVRPTAAEKQMHDTLEIYSQRVWHGLGVRNPAARLAMTILRRRASSSAAALARSVARRLALLGSAPPAASQLSLPFERSDDHADDDLVLCAPGLADAADEHLALTRLLRLAHAAAMAGESKVRALERLLRRARQPAIVFTEYRDTLTMVAEALPVGAAVFLHGGLSAAERRLSVREFTSGSATLLLATDAASEGLNLHHRSRLVINLELPWTPLRLEQRVGRVERIGQARPVHDVRLVARDTSEERVVSRVVERHSRAVHELNALRRRPPDESAIADAVMDASVDARRAGMDEEANRPAHRAGTGDILAVDLRHEATEQAEHLERMRRLRAQAAATPASVSPVISRAPGRHGPSLFVYRLSFGDDEGIMAATALVTLQFSAGLRAARTPADMRDAVRRLRDALHGELASMEQWALARLQGMIDTSYTAADLRERAIAASLREERARIAERLLQPGLFDRRSEREGANSDTVAAAALARCRARLDEHARLRRLRVTGRSLALALLGV